MHVYQLDIFVWNEVIVPLTLSFKPSHRCVPRLGAVLDGNLRGSLRSFLPLSLTPTRILELQVFLTELIGSFEFSVAVPEDKIKRDGGGIMVPVVYGEEEKGSQLPFRIKVVQ